MNKYFIKIDGAGFINKGAELMLYSASNYILSNFENTKLVLGPPRFNSFDQYSFSEVEFYKEESYRFLGSNLWNAIPSEFLIRRGLVKSSMIKAILDIGGFSLGDQWADIKKYSIENNKKLASFYKRYKDCGTKIIFLPQAYGPFNNKFSRDRIKRISNHIDAFYARDIQSYEYLTKVIPEEKVKMSPDFTNLQISDNNIKEIEIAQDSVLIIPNEKMLSKTDNSISDSYVVYLSKLIQSLSEKGHKIVILNHEGEDDSKVIEGVLNKTIRKIPVIENLNSLQIKGVIGVSKIVISSRYHGLISALNQGIPAFSTSWSHKYETLLGEYDLDKNILEICPDQINEQTDRIIQTANDPEIKNKIKKCSDSNRFKVLQMWKEVEKMLDLKRLKK